MSVCYAGNVSASLVRIGELFRDAVRLDASGVVLDHVVIGHDNWVSLRDRGVTFDRPGSARANRRIGVDSSGAPPGIPPLAGAPSYPAGGRCVDEGQHHGDNRGERRVKGFHLKAEILDDFVVAANDETRRLLARLARTPGGFDAYPNLAPPRKYAWRAEEGGARTLLVRTPAHGPAELLRVSPATGGEALVSVLVPHPDTIARPEALGEVVVGLHATLARIAGSPNLSAVDRATPLREAIEMAAIQLLDPDTLERQERIRTLLRRGDDYRSQHPYRDVSEFSYQAGVNR